MRSRLYEGQGKTRLGKRVTLKSREVLEDVEMLYDVIKYAPFGIKGFHKHMHPDFFFDANCTLNERFTIGVTGFYYVTTQAEYYETSELCSSEKPTFFQL